MNVVYDRQMYATIYFPADIVANFQGVKQVLFHVIVCQETVVGLTVTNAAP